MLHNDQKKPQIWHIKVQTLLIKIHYQPEPGQNSLYHPKNSTSHFESESQKLKLIQVDVWDVLQPRCRL